MSIRILIITGFCALAIQSNAQPVLTAREAVEMALEHNYGIKVARNTVDIAENNKNILNTGYLPTLTGTAGATVNSDNTEAVFSNGDQTNLRGAQSSRYNSALSLNYTLFDGLGRMYNYRRLKEQYHLSELEARETIENTILQIFTVYYSIAQLTENRASFEQVMAISRERLLRTEYQFEYGQNTKLGALNAKVDLNNDSVNLINNQQQLIAARRDLNVLLGNQLDDTFDVGTDINFLLQADRSNLLSKTKANNVSLLQAEQNISINEFNIKTSKARYLPSVDLTGTYGWNKNNNNAAAFVAVSTTTGLSGAVNLTWNLFDGGSTITQVRNARINLETQKLQRAQIILDVERNFNNAWDDYKNKLRIFYVQEDNIKTAQNNFDRTEEQFKLGQVTSIEFRQAQLNLLNAQLSRNQAKYNAKLAELTMLQLSGELLNVDF